MTIFILDTGFSATGDDLDEAPICWSTNPGPVGQDTGFVFKARKLGGAPVRVIAKLGESREHAIERVMENLGGAIE
jgi:hypothetical protein